MSKSKVLLRASRVVHKAINVAVLITSCVVVYACSSDAKLAQKPASVTDDPVADGPEAASIQKYLDSYYAKSDVVHSFRTKFGEDVDCIDFYAQPSVRALIARGEHVEIPVPPPLPSSSERQDARARDAFAEAVAFNGEPDENGNPRRCPGTTVPRLRKSVAQIKAAGGLTEYLKLRTHAPIHPRPPGAQVPEVTGFFHVIAEYPIPPKSTPACGTNGSCRYVNDGQGPPCPSGQPVCPPEPVQGGEATFSIYDPTPDPGGHSLAQTWTFSGNNVSDLTGCHECTTDCTQSVEIGWMVDPTQFQFTNNPNSPHLFVYSTQDGYWATGAYANEPGPPPNCLCVEFFTGVCGLCGSDHFLTDPFISIPLPPGTPQFVPGMALPIPASTLGQTPNEVKFTTANDLTGNGWFVFVNNVAIGKYPSSAFNRADRLPDNGSLASTASAFWAGGEVSGPSGSAYNQATPAVGNMGSGIGAPLGYKEASYLRNFKFFVPDRVSGFDTVANSLFTVQTMDPNCYNAGPGFSGIPAVGSPAPGGSNWGNYMYFGGLGRSCGSFWQAFPGSCDACCNFVPSNIAASGSCPSTLLPGQACDSFCLQPQGPPPPQACTQ